MKKFAKIFGIIALTVTVFTFLLGLYFIKYNQEAAITLAGISFRSMYIFLIAAFASAIIVLFTNFLKEKAGIIWAVAAVCMTMFFACVILNASVFGTIILTHFA